MSCFAASLGHAEKGVYNIKVREVFNVEHKVLIHGGGQSYEKAALPIKQIFLCTKREEKWSQMKAVNSYSTPRMHMFFFSSQLLHRPGKNAIM